MPRPVTSLGDSHNFGRRVTRGANVVKKPRPLLWEWLFLSKQSPLRAALRRAALAGELGEGAFEFLPSLRFKNFDRATGGEVQRIALAPLEKSQTRRRELACVMGRALALFSFLGLSDLHWENLALGVDAGGRLIFGPLDVEMILADLALPTETKLLPDADPEYAELCRHAAGARRALAHLGKPIAPADLVAMAAEYARALIGLEAQATELARVFGDLPAFERTPIRVCLRSTGDYLAALERPLSPPLLDAEREQLLRGDIPYFFRLYGRPGIHYYSEPTLQEIRRLPLRGDVPRLEPLLSIERGLRSPKRETLRNEGLMTVLGAFDHPSFSGTHTSGSFSVTFKPRRLVVEFGDGEQIVAHRNLVSVVGSVYLDCRCGEVRSVLVPETTRCRPSAGTRPQR